MIKFDEGVFIKNQRMQVKGYGETVAIGCGRFSTVYKVQELSSKRIFAIKSVSPSFKGSDNGSIYREIQSLSVADHPNIVKLHEVVVNQSSINIVMEYIPYNLSDVISQHSISEALTKGIMVQLFRGLAHIHGIGIIHRDIKPQNLLVSKAGILKICDLGLSRFLADKSASQDSDNNHSWTLQVGTHFYRAPELIYGDRNYGPAIDIWAAGCVMAEMLTGSPLFPGTGDFELLSMIADILGDACEENWPGISVLADFGKICFCKKTGKSMREVFPSFSDEAIDLLSKIIIYDPAKRITAKDALKHKWFRTEPAPIIAPFNGKEFDLLNFHAI